MQKNALNLRNIFEKNIYEGVQFKGIWKEVAFGYNKKSTYVNTGDNLRPWKCHACMINTVVSEWMKKNY